MPDGFLDGSTSLPSLPDSVTSPGCRRNVPVASLRPAPMIVSHEQGMDAALGGRIRRCPLREVRGHLRLRNRAV